MESICNFASKASESCYNFDISNGSYEVAEIMILTYLNETGIIIIRKLIMIRKLKIF